MSTLSRLRRLVAMALVATLPVAGGVMCHRWKEARHETAAKVQSVSMPVAVPTALADPEHSTLSDVAESRVAGIVNVSSTRVVKLAGGGLPFQDDPFFKYFFGPSAPAVPPDKRQKSLGSGVVVSADGVILTNSHVVDGADEIEVTLPDERKLEAKVVGADPQSDLAVIRLEGDVGGLTPVPFGDSDGLRLGEVVLAIGSPFGLDHTVTMGIISAKGRSNVGINDYEDFIQTDAAINPGNSGGALIDLKGELVGINTAIVSRTGGYEGIGFAIPSNMARKIMDDLLENGKVIRGWLGVVIQDVDSDMADALGLDSAGGVLVADVEEGSPASRGGLERGDVIVRMDGKAVEDVGRFRNDVAELGSGARVELEVLRDKEQRKLEVTLGELDEEGGAAAPAASGKAEGGMGLVPLDPAIHGPEGYDSGLVVTHVDPGSAAEEAGLQHGDVILEVGGQKVATTGAFRKQYEASGKHVLILVLRDGKPRYLTLKKD
jgi:serine protease Do